MYNNTNPIYGYVPGGYKNGFIPPVIGAELDRLTFSRTSVGTRRRKDGLIENLSSNVPRLNYDYNNNCPYLLLEPQATNLFPNSADFTQSNWSTTSVTVDQFVTAAPDGSNTGMKLTVNASGTRYASDNVTLVINEKAQISCFAKAGNTGYFALACVDAFGPTTDEAIGTFDLVNGKVGSTSLSSGVTPTLSIEPYENGWYRCKMEFVATSSGAWNGRILCSTEALDDITGRIGDHVFAWGAQAEVSEECTSYIPSGGTTTTRVGESATNGLTSTAIRSPEGAIYVEFENTADPINGFRTISLSDGTNQEFVKIQQSGATPGTMFVNITVKGVTQVNVAINDTNILERNKIAVVWGIKDSARVYLNGEFVSFTNPFQTFTPSILNRLNFGNETGALPYYGKIYDLRVYDVFAMNMDSDRINRFFKTLTN